MAVAAIFKFTKITKFSLKVTQKYYFGINLIRYYIKLFLKIKNNINLRSYSFKLIQMKLNHRVNLFQLFSQYGKTSNKCKNLLANTDKSRQIKNLKKKVFSTNSIFIIYYFWQLNIFWNYKTACILTNIFESAFWVFFSVNSLRLFWRFSAVDKIRQLREVLPSYYNKSSVDFIIRKALS